ncbi:hypothetical protein AB0P07_20755 [Streptomyces sp. NPDC085944]|uniref:hypothetical protein n=1 Tax=Streptomyces sp. NPDC085944 TaxID=3154962 RepID=UPI003414F8C4
MFRLRIKVTHCPRRALALTDTPRPDCPDCLGEGGMARHYGDHTGEYAGTEWESCPCWTQWAVILLPLPRWPRRTPTGYSDEPPF